MKENPFIKPRQPWRMMLAQPKSQSKQTQKNFLKSLNIGRYGNKFKKIKIPIKHLHLYLVVLIYIYLFFGNILNLITALSLGFVSLVLSDHILEIIKDYYFKFKGWQQSKKQNTTQDEKPVKEHKTYPNQRRSLYGNLPLKARCETVLHSQDKAS